MVNQVQNTAPRLRPLVELNSRAIIGQLKPKADSPILRAPVVEPTKAEVSIMGNDSESVLSEQQQKELDKQRALQQQKIKDIKAQLDALR
jgi:hypothetical protein